MASTASENKGSLALVTGASSGIGLELARQCANAGFNLVIAAKDGPLDEVAAELRAMGVEVDAVLVDLARPEGVATLCERLGGRPVDALLANAGQGLGHAFLDQDLDDIFDVINTNVSGTVQLLHLIVNDMRARRKGRVLITGSIAGVLPGSFQAIYNASKAFLDSFSYALRNEVAEYGITVTVLMPGPTDTNFFANADMLDTKIGQQKKDDPADVARVGFKAMMAGEGGVVSGIKNKVQVAMAHVTPDAMLAGQHRKMAEPK